MFKRSHTLLRRAAALLMCVCMVMGNISVAASGTIEYFSEPVRLTSARRSAASGAEVPLSDYAKFSYTLAADRNGTALPDVVGDGQSLFFQLAFDLKKQEGLYLLRQAYQNGLVDQNTTFTADISFLNLLKSHNYPTSFDSPDNIASDGDVNIFRWWVNEATGEICLRFYENVYEGEGDVSNTKVAFEGTLDTSGHDNDGQLNFGVDNLHTSLIAKQGYALTKKAGVPYYNAEAASYLVNYTVTLTLDQKMKLNRSVQDALYCAALSLEDTVLSGGALTGVLYGDVAIVAPEDETAGITLTSNGVTNTMDITSPDQVLNKGVYTITYTMKIDRAAANAKLENYTAEQKTNTVEVKENSASLSNPLTAKASISWENVTSGQYKVEKLAFLDQGEDYYGVYMDTAKQKYYIDFRVVVYLKDAVETFTVTDVDNYAIEFRKPEDKPVTLEGICTTDGYWDTPAANHTLTTLTSNQVIVTNTVNESTSMCEIVVSAPAGQKLQPGAYHLRVPADVTDAVKSAINNKYPQYYENTATLTSVNGAPTNESDSFKQSIPRYDYVTKDGGYVLDSETGGLKLTPDGRPIIRWDVYFSWDFYHTAVFTDTMENQEMLLGDGYTLDVHQMQNMGNKISTLASYSSATNTSNITFTKDENGAVVGYTLNTANLAPAGTNVKMYKLVYFTVPKMIDTESGSYYTSGLKNNYDVTFKPPFGHDKGFGPGPGSSEPSVSADATLKITKNHMYDENDTHNRWHIRVDNNTNHIPIRKLNKLIISDRLAVEENRETFGSDVTIDYSKPIDVYIEYFKGDITNQKKRVKLQEGVHYTIEKQNSEAWYQGYLSLGTNSQYGFGVNINTQAVATLLDAENSTYFRYIDVEFSSQNPVISPNSGYDILNRGYLDYEFLTIHRRLEASAKYNRKFSTKRKEAPLYGDYYDPSQSTNVTNHSDGSTSGYGDWTVGLYDDNPANGDGKDEILWKIFIGAREFENSTVPIQVTITDTLSDNMIFPQYDGIDLEDLFLIEATKSRGHVLTPDRVDVNGQTFTLTFTVPAGAWAGGGGYSSSDIEIVYHTVLRPEAIDAALKEAPADAKEVQLSYSNTASVSWNGDTYTLPTSNGSTTFSTAMLDKASTIVTAVSEIEYQIEINEHALLLNGGNPLVLEDELGAGADNFLYRDDSVTLKNLNTGALLTKGSAVSDSTYTIVWAQGENKGFTISVPDGQRLLLTYRVKPMVSVGEETTKLVNTASLNGKIVSHDQNGFQVNASNQEASYTPPEGTAAVKIRKLEGGSSVQVLLQGATFAAYPVKADGTLGEAVQTRTTDATGCATFAFQRNGDKDYDTVYCIKEVSAPAGYVASSAEWYFYFSTASKQYANAEVESIVNLLLGNGKNVQRVMNQTVHQQNVENTPVTCDLLLYKQSKTGDFLSGAAFTLQDANGNSIAGPVETVVDGKTVYLFTDLKGGNYTLTETKAPAGYVCGEISQWNITLDAVTKSVTINWEEGTSDATNATTSTGDDAAVLAITNDEAASGELVIPVVKMLNGTNSTDQVFTFKLWTDDPTAPMPADIEGAECFVTTEDAVYTTDGKTTVSFPAILFDWDTVGKEYSYFVKEEAVAANTGFTMADAEAVYQLIVKPEWDDDEAEIVVAVEACYYKGTTQHDGDLVFENIYEETISLEGQKYWNDQLNSMGTQPEEITIKLMNGTTQVQSCIASAANGWKFQFDNLPRFDEDGNEIQYTIEEVLDEPLNYLPEYSEVTYTNGAFKGDITNHQLVRHTIQKEWDDGDDQDDLRPDSLSVTLTRKLVHEQANEELVIGTYELNDANNWTVTVSEYQPDPDDPDATAYLLAYDAWGNAYDYVWSEPTVTDYTPADEPVVTQNKNHITTTLTNSYTPETTEATVVKVWDDGDDQDGKRPETLTVTLSNGTTTVATATLNEANNWTATEENLPKYADGIEITYTWTEDETALPEGYELTDTVTEGTITTLTNSYTPEVVSISGAKTWDDLDNACKKRPASITIRLYADNVEVAKQEVTAADNWSWSFTDLPKYGKGKVGHELTYTIAEDSVPGYVATPAGYDLTNSLLVVAFQKLDEQTGNPLSGAEFALYAGRQTTPTGTALETWTADGTPKLLAGLTADEAYTIFETKTPDGFVTMTPYVFTVRQTDTPDNLRTFTAANRHSYRFRKLSSTDGALVYGAQLAIKQGDTTLATWSTSGDNNGWHTVADERFTAGVTYTLVELSAPAGYQLAAPISFSIDLKDGFLIVNGKDTDKADVVMYDQPIPEVTPTPEPETTSFRVTKRWQDRENVLGLRPNSIVVNLYRKTSNSASYPDTPYLTVTMNSNGTDEWRFTFSDLPLRDAEGRLYTYMAQEEPVEGYVAKYLNNGKTIINAIPEEDLPPTPTPTLPYVTPTPSPMPRHPVGVQFIDGQWVYVDEYGIPLGTVPLTGDHTNFTLWGVAIVLPLIVAALAAVEIRRRKRLMAAQNTHEE